MGVRWSLPLSAQGLSPEPRAAGTAVLSVRDLVCVVCAVWSVLYVLPFMVSVEAGPAGTSERGGWADNDTFPLQGPRDRSPALTGLLLSLPQQKGKAGPKLFPERCPAGSTGQGLSLAAGFYHKLPLPRPLPFLPFCSLSCCSDREGRWPWCLVQAAGQDRCEMWYHFA